MVKFNKYNVQANGLKVRVWYSLDNRGDNRKCVKLYAKDYGYALGKIFPNEHENNSDVRSDYLKKARSFFLKIILSMRLPVLK